MDLVPIYRSAVRQFDSRVRAVADAQWASKTPDTEWDVRDLVAHVIDGQRAVAGVIDGAFAVRHGSAAVETDRNTSAAAASDDVGAGRAGAATGGSEELGDDLIDAWEQASAAAVQALSRPGALDGEVPDRGMITALQYGWRAATELTVHAWDLARATNGVDEFPNDLIGEVLDHAKSSYDRWYSDERYAPSIPVPGCTDDLIELLALTGRNRWWRPA